MNPFWPKKISGVRGFTLIELIVAVSVFVTLVTIAAGGFVSVLRSQRQAASLIAVNNDISLVLEAMAREIRTGRNFCDPTPCGPEEIRFYNTLRNVVTYRRNFTSAVDEFIERAETPPGGVNTFLKITSERVRVRNLFFFVQGAKDSDPVDEWPTRVTITVGASSKERIISEGVVRLQTTISSRQKDE